MSAKNIVRTVAASAGVLLVFGAAGPGAAATRTADSGDVRATVQKTVLKTGNAKGEIATSRMYTQVSAVGDGTQTVTVPVGTTSNRNLNEFGAFPMEGESIVFDLTVDGAGVEQRSLTDADISPMEVSVKVMLDGVEVAPEDLVGASGVLDVEYTVRNTTVTTSPVTFTDVEGKEVTEDVETATPFAGSLDVILPRGFNEVTAPGANVVGNGQNQTQLAYSFVLFPPLGSAEVKVAYQSRISNGEMPAAEFLFLPLVPFDNSTIAGTVEAYRGGAETGATIFGAGTQIGDNLLKLQDGAGQLVAGLGQLSAGAAQLSDGLVNTAAPGSAALADGANQVSDGLDQLNENVPALEEGVSDLNAGAKKLNSGAETVADGNASLAAGIASLNTGLNTLSKSVDALPATVQEQLKTNVDYQTLLGTLTKLIAGIGGPDDKTTSTLQGVLNNMKWGLRSPEGYPNNDCVAALAGGTPAKCGAMDAVEYISVLLADGATNLEGTLKPIVLGLYAGSYPPQPACPSAPGTPVLPPSLLPAGSSCSAISSIFYALYAPAGAPGFPLGGLSSQASKASVGLTNVYKQVDAKVIGEGIAGLKKALYNTPCDPKQTNSSASDFCGYAQALTLVRDGIPQLVSALTTSIKQTLLAGIGTSPAAKGCDPTKSLTCASAALTAGSAALATGASQLADGTEDLAAGTKTLNSKVPTLAAGVEQLDDGAAQVADGADQLADGLGTAADGSGQLADGLAQAEPGGAQIEDGAGQLKEEGADVLAASGKDAQLGFAKDVAMLEAAQQAGLEGAGIPFGPAEGANVVTTAVYKMELAGITTEEENTALKYGLAILLLIAGGLAGVAGVQRLAR